MASSSPTKPPPTKVTRSASCLCGAVAVTINGVDKGAVLCHCSNCQKSSGSSFAHNYRFLDADLTFDKGQDAVTRYEDGNTTNGNVLARHFCKVCGSNVYLQPCTPPRMFILHTGGMQDKTQPARELFTHNKHPWVGDVTPIKAKV
ncbi:hypothetical protein LTR91_006570 [Friedmanniomyces endolithicus]|uniref:CENP-V/GFA domain-containing protein n=1 Tax=Friedmanniomyces endolithicus TaxID=329885 RepID=A0AAN6FP64_9PEZI|nr:hypothetical protein LTS09_006678 [Friedmanniomyces endolithicus]KAK0282831.1 hypothetical protein LTR35_006623 [Friedmanniomyces endolithicus]KAK0297115.1 hypothetical protein LTS00_004394 [Friedmanniomyces endolithicus]KAK0320678.1 hypothetical protein LTR82_008391 [Friedmanniomyces endolithicus]KAK0928082.1 hypothetical protein LTR57_002816 [Friedmanniomyces endolithicus]